MENSSIPTTIGKNVLDNLTTGLYKHSKVIYREYIQNSCDQIDVALKKGLIHNLDECEINIQIGDGQNERNVSITDNATGVKESHFREEIGSIANSNKKNGESRGFRGIGRLCGAAYCQTLRFSTSYKGEASQSSMTIDAKKMRELVGGKEKYTVEQVWEQVVSFETRPWDEEDHFFKVELFDINPENDEILNKDEIVQYLSFVAPAPYDSMMFGSFPQKIHEEMRKRDAEPTEYIIRVNGNQIKKPYNEIIKDDNGQEKDKIEDLDIREFKDKDGKLLAWGWVGRCENSEQIPKKNNPMRGIRIRSGNIQIGNDEVLRDFFSEPRGVYYFVGEIFIVSKNLIPNSQRDYFNENPARKELDAQLREYCAELKRRYHDSNKIVNNIKAVQRDEKLNEEYEQKCKEGFANKKEEKNLTDNLSKSSERARKAQRELQKCEQDFQKDPNSPKSVQYQIIKARRNPSQALESAAKTERKAAKAKANKAPYLSQQIDNLTPRERKIVDIILSIITDRLQEDAGPIIREITEEIKKI